MLNYSKPQDGAQKKENNLYLPILIFYMVQIKEAKNLVLLDTCFILANLDDGKELKKLEAIPNIATTSFNIEELLHVHKIKHNVKKNMKKFLKESKIKIINIDVHPGEWVKEREFVESVDKELLSHVHDASDAVLMAVAIQTKSNVATKDKHHLFTTDLQNFLQQHQIKVFKEIKDFTL